MTNATVPPRPPQVTSDFVTVRALARRRGCSPYAIMKAAVEGFIQTAYLDGRLVVIASSAEGWNPDTAGA